MSRLSGWVGEVFANVLNLTIWRMKVQPNPHTSAGTVWPEGF